VRGGLRTDLRKGKIRRLCSGLLEKRTRVRYSCSSVETKIRAPEQDLSLGRTVGPNKRNWGRKESWTMGGFSRSKKKVQRAGADVGEKLVRGPSQGPSVNISPSTRTIQGWKGSQGNRGKGDLPCVVRRVCSLSAV